MFMVYDTAQWMVLAEVSAVSRHHRQTRKLNEPASDCSPHPCGTAVPQAKLAEATENRLNSFCISPRIVFGAFNYCCCVLFCCVFVIRSQYVSQVVLELTVHVAQAFP